VWGTAMARTLRVACRACSEAGAVVVATPARPDRRSLLPLSRAAGDGAGATPPRPHRESFRCACCSRSLCPGAITSVVLFAGGSGAKSSGRGPSALCALPVGARGDDARCGVLLIAALLHRYVGLNLDTGEMMAVKVRARATCCCTPSYFLNCFFYCVTNVRSQALDTGDIAARELAVLVRRVPQVVARGARAQLTHATALLLSSGARGRDDARAAP
jgi:hypothetical protein